MKEPEVIITDENETISEDFAAIESTIDDTRDMEKLSRKHAIKSDIITLASTALISSIPMIVDSLKHRNDPIPYKTKTADITRVIVASAIPAIKTIDTVVFNGKIQKTMSEKSPFSFNDVQNVVNIIQMYPTGRMMLQNSIDNSINNPGHVKVELPEGVTAKFWLSGINLITPYIVNKMTDPTMTFKEKLGSALPVGLFGSVVKRFFDRDPKARQFYNTAETMVNLAKTGTNALSSTTSSAIAKKSNQIGGILDTIQDLTGMRRSNGYGGYNNNYGNNYWGSSGRNDYWNGCY